MGQSLYSLSEEYKMILDLLEDTPETEGLESELDKIGESIDKKIENLALVVRTMAARGEVISIEMERLLKKKRTVENAITRLKTYIKDTMDAIQLKRAGGPLASVTVQISNPSVEILDMDAIPDAFKEAELVIPLDSIPSSLLDYIKKTSLNKKNVLDLLKEGVEIPGAFLKTGNHIVIR